MSDPAESGTRWHGHRGVPHTADVRLEAWAPDRQHCLVEAVAGLVDGFAEVPRGADRTVTVDFADTDGTDLLVSVLDTVIYLVETRGGVPVDTEAEAHDGGTRMHFHLADLEHVTITGAVPKAVTLHDLRFGPGEAGWFCAATVDV